MQVSRTFQIFNNGISSREMELSMHVDNDYDGMFGALILFLRKPSDLTNLYCNQESWELQSL
jgi:hypothetical protein